MNHTINHLGDVTLVRLDGEIDLATAPRLRSLFQGLLDEGRTHLLLDLDDVPFIDSSGLGILVNAYKMAQTRGGDVKFVHACREVRKIFRLTRTDKYFEFYESVEAGSGAFVTV